MSTTEFVRIEKQDVITLNGQDIPFCAVGEDFPLHSADGTLAGSLFTYSYLRTDVEDTSKRPVLFAYNGGPGSSAAWIYTGFLSPKQIVMDEKFRTSTHPDSHVQDNPNCLLDICDVVIMDMPHTGNSLVLDETKIAEFFGTAQDAQAFADVIRNWLIKYDRIESPKYLLGESYGTIRTASLVNALYGRPMYPGSKCYGITVDGVILMGSLILNKPGKTGFEESGIPAASLELPTVAATRWYHRRPEGVTLEEFVEGAYEFATGDYLTLLSRMNRMPEEEFRAAVEKLVYYTGVGEAVLRKYGYELPSTIFARELLAEEGKDIGMYDTRFTMHAAPEGMMADPVGDDPAMGLYTAPYKKAHSEIQKYYLGEDFQRDFSIIDFTVNGPWDHTATTDAFRNLQMALRRSKDFRILWTNGVYDLVTTIGLARYGIAHLQQEPGQIICREYPSGHMSYVGEESQKLLTGDIRSFLLGEEMTSCF